MPIFIITAFRAALGYSIDKMRALWDIKLKIAAFIIDRWRVFLVLAILVGCLVYVLALRHERNAALEDKTVAEKALFDHLATDKLMAEQRAIENKQKAEQGRLALIRIKQMHHDDMLAIMVRANKQVKKLKKEKDHEKEISDRAVNNYRDGLRLAIQRESDAAARLPQDDANRTAGTDSDATASGRSYTETLKQAGAICAADYNFCRNYVLNEQQRLGVEK